MDNTEVHLLNIDDKLAKADWSERIELMYEHQLETWKMAHTHYGQFESVVSRTILFDDFKFDLQYNPARARSTCADLSKKTIENRKCFLCPQNLPPEQKGFLLLDRYLLLVNPFPIFKRHLTISAINHTPQTIIGKLADMLEIARELSGFTVFYNGPRCGASAPDHFHFQAVPFGSMPVDNEIDKLSPVKGKIYVDEDTLRMYSLSSYLRTILIFDSTETCDIEKAFDCICKKLPFDAESNEPMMNLLANYRDGKYRLVLFPRKAQRPSCYYREGADRILVSPASVELGGTIVTPNEDNFKNLTKHDIIGIFNDVSPLFPIYK